MLLCSLLLTSYVSRVESYAHGVTEPHAERVMLSLSYGLVINQLNLLSACTWKFTQNSYDKLTKPRKKHDEEGKWSKWNCEQLYKEELYN